MRKLFILLLAVFTSNVVAAPPIYTADNYNIEVTGVEISQGIQNMDNDIPLIAGRKIIVRVYARETTGKTITNVVARLNADATYTLPPPAENQGAGGGVGMTLYSQPVTVTSDGSNRLNYSDSFNFEFVFDTPPEAISPLNSHFLVTVNYDRLDQESNASDNTQEIADRDLYNIDSYKIHFVPVHLHSNPSDPNSTVLEHQLFEGENDLYIINSVLRYTPLIRVNGMFDWQSQPLYPPGHANGIEWDLSTSPGRTAVNTALYEMELLDDEGRQYHGMVNPSANGGGYSGWSKNGASWSKFSQTMSASSPWFVSSGATLTHELMHSIKHMPCTGGESNPDNNYPWPYLPPFYQCQLADVDSNGYFGLDVYHQDMGQAGIAVISNDPNISAPNLGFPFMGYREPRWVSPYEYCKLLVKFGVPCDIQWPDPPVGQLVPDLKIQAKLDQNYQVFSNAKRFVWVSLFLDEIDKSAKQFKVLQLDNYSTFELARATQRRKLQKENGSLSDWRIEVTDSYRQVLSQHYIAATGGPDTLETAITNADNRYLYFADLIAFPEAASSLQIFYKDNLVATKSLSNNKPEIFWNSGNLGVLQPGSKLRWRATDLDGDSLHYSLLFSSDGKRFKPVQINLSDESLVVTKPFLDDLDSSNSAYFKVLVSDGFRSNSVISPSFIVPPRQPKILGPNTFSASSSNEVKLWAMAVDDKKQDISDRLQWYQGARVIGRGAKISYRKTGTSAEVLTLKLGPDLVVSKQIQVQ